MTPDDLNARTKKFAVDAVCRAKSRADFINKLSGAVEEADELDTNSGSIPRNRTP
jgi:hypothetical protein